MSHLPEAFCGPLGGRSLQEHAAHPPVPMLHGEVWTLRQACAQLVLQEPVARSGAARAKRWGHRARPTWGFGTHRVQWQRRRGRVAQKGFEPSRRASSGRWSPRLPGRRTAQVQWARVCTSASGTWGRGWCGARSWGEPWAVRLAAGRGGAGRVAASLPCLPCLPPGHKPLHHRAAPHRVLRQDLAGEAALLDSHAGRCVFPAAVR